MCIYLGNTLQEEAARARERCAWAEFKELSLILAAHGASSMNIKWILCLCLFVSVHSQFLRNRVENLQVWQWLPGTGRGGVNNSMGLRFFTTGPPGPYHYDLGVCLVWAIFRDMSTLWRDFI